MCYLQMRRLLCKMKERINKINFERIKCYKL
jgi:hypothetical protein